MCRPLPIATRKVCQRTRKKRRKSVAKTPRRFLNATFRFLERNIWEILLEFRLDRPAILHACTMFYV